MTIIRLLIKHKRAFVAALALSVSSCAAAPSQETVTSDQPAFVSLNPCMDAILVEVADPEQILALSHYSRDPAAASMDVDQAMSFGVTGGTAEEIIALKPDIVLASSFIAPSTKEALARLGIDPIAFGIASNVQTNFAQIRKIAQLAEHKERGEALIMQIEAALENTAKGPQISAVLWQPGQIVPGGEVLISELMAAAGFTNHSSMIGMQQADFLSLESMLHSPPDVILVAGDSPAQDHPALSGLESTQIVQFDPSLLYCGGPTIIRALNRLNQIRTELGKEKT